MRVRSQLLWDRAPAPPGPSPGVLLGHIRRRQRDPLALFRECIGYGDVVLLRWGPPWLHLENFLVNHPEGIRHVLVSHRRNYRKHEAYDKGADVIGDGLLRSEGELWLSQRSRLQPAFHRSRLAAYAPAMTEATARMLADWPRRRRDGETFDLQAEMQRLTLVILGRTLFGTDLSRRADAIREAFATVSEHVHDRIMLLYFDFLLAPRVPRYRAALAVLREVAEDILAEHAAGSDAALLRRLAAGSQAEGAAACPMHGQHKLWRDEILTFFFAGHDSSATALTWAFYLLARNPEARCRLEDEIDGVLAGRPPAYEDLPRLPWTRAVVQETLRLYPPVWLFGRENLADDHIGGYRIPAGSIVQITPFITHRDPRFWPDPDVFDPGRFLGSATARPRYAYLPFGGGGHTCIGRHFAMMEMQLVLATIAGRFRVAPVAGRAVEPEAGILLKPRGGLPVTVEER